MRSMTAFILAWLAVQGAAFSVEGPVTTSPRLAPRFSGRVGTEGTPAAVAGVQVILRRAEHVVARTTTDLEGRFTLHAPAGSYVLSIADRFSTAVAVVDRGGAQNLSVFLPRASLSNHGSLSRAEWLAVGGGVVLFAVPVGVMIGASGNDLSVSP
jgi:hypothetical protein